MYACSSDFHKAVAEDAPQIAMLIFKDMIFTNSDINIDDGIVFTDNFNAEDDIEIGQALSNEITFTLFNDVTNSAGKRLLSDYKFGDFQATIGAKIDEKTYVPKGLCRADTGSGTYIGRASAPYLTRNNETVSAITFPVHFIFGYNGKVYVVGNSTGRWAVLDDKTGQDITGDNSVNLFMRKKAVALDGHGYYYNANTRKMSSFYNGKCEWYEFVPLGYFTAERPDEPDMDEISFTCYDYMQKLEKDMPEADKLGITYPVALNVLFDKIAKYCEVKCKKPSMTINADRIVPKAPNDFKSATCRTVIGWIAEAAGSNAKFNRDGVLVMDWLRDTSTKFNESNYQDYKPKWYETPKIDKLYNRDTSGNSERTYGSGKNAYLILDNPFLRGEG